MRRFNCDSFLATALLPVLLIISMSGCAAAGLGAAAGATVGGCALLDADEDETVTAEEVGAGLFAEWDADGNEILSEKEFDVGAQATGVFTDRPGGFDAWDTDGNDELTKAEFEAGVGEDDAEAWADATCDELGL